MESIDPKKFQKLLNRHVLLPMSFGLLSVIFLVGIISYLLALSRWVEQSDLTINNINVMIKLMVDQETGLRGFLIIRDEKYLQPYLRSSELLPATIDKLRTALGQQENQKRRLSIIIETYQRWHDYAEKAIALRGQNIDLRDIAAVLPKQLMDDIRHQAEALLAEQEDIKTQHNQRARILVLALLGGFFALNLLLSGLLALVGRRQMIGLAAVYDKLLSELDQQNTALLEEEWLRTSELGLAEKVIGQLPLPILCQSVLEYLAARTDMLIGAIYVMRGEEYFRREANYGFSKDNAQREQQFALREGLIGQAAMENRIIHLSDVPVDYLKVNSGLGSAVPPHILLVPIRDETTTIAVLELGFLRDLEQRDFVFLERIAENIGVAIVAANYRRRLHETLLEMQQLNEELQTRQEELRSANEELEEQSQFLAESRQQLEQAVRMRDDFMSIVSHELRTPLNTFKLEFYTRRYWLENGHLDAFTPEKIERMIATDERQLDRLLHLINDILDVSRIRTGQLSVRPMHIDLTLLVGEVAEQFRSQLKAAGCTAKIHAPTVVTGYWDEFRLEQVLANLLLNAMRYGAGKVIEIRVEEVAAGASFSVRDYGAGISLDEQQRIFHQFERGGRDRKGSGLGLGLFIADQIVKAHGGWIDVSSEPGQGALFSVTLPRLQSSIESS